MRTVNYFDSFAKVLDKKAWNVDTAPWARWAWDILRSEIGEAENALIVDLGTGTGAGIAYLLPITKNARFIGIDFSYEMIRAAKEKFNGIACNNIQFIQGRLDELKLDESTVDYFISAGTFHHIKNKEKVFSILIKALKPGGKFINIDHFKAGQRYNDQMRKLREENPAAAEEDDEAYEKIKWIYQQDTNHPIEFHTDPYEFKDLLEACGFFEAKVHVSFHPNYSVVVAEKAKQIQKS